MFFLPVRNLPNGKLLLNTHKHTHTTASANWMKNIQSERNAPKLWTSDRRWLKWKMPRKRQTERADKLCDAETRRAGRIACRRPDECGGENSNKSMWVILCSVDVGCLQCWLVIASFIKHNFPFISCSARFILCCAASFGNKKNLVRTSTVLRTQSMKNGDQTEFKVNGKKEAHTAQNSPKQYFSIQYSLWWIVNLCDAAKYGQDQAIACTLSMPPRSLIIKCTVLRSKRKGFRSHKLIFVSDLRPACAICAEWTKEPNENGRQTTIKSTIRSREKRSTVINSHTHEAPMEYGQSIPATIRIEWNGNIPY